MNKLDRAIKMLDSNSVQQAVTKILQIYKREDEHYVESLAKRKQKPPPSDNTIRGMVEHLKRCDVVSGLSKQEIVEAAKISLKEIARIDKQIWNKYNK